MRIFRVGNAKKCGGCNYEVGSMYFIDNTKRSAVKNHRKGKSLCSECLVKMIIDEDLKIEVK